MYLVLSLNISKTLPISVIYTNLSILYLLDSFSSLFTNDYLDNKFISVQFKFCNELRFRETINIKMAILFKGLCFTLQVFIINQFVEPVVLPNS